MWNTFHKYSQLVRDGKIAPLKCPDCEYILAIRLNEELDLPMLWCSTEDRFIRPGLDLKDRIKELVNSVART